MSGKKNSFESTGSTPIGRKKNGGKQSNRPNSLPPKNGLRTLGPVSDLERHLPAEWWRTLFNSVYIKTDGDVVENNDITRTEVDEIIAATGVESSDRILDLCCGQGRHCLEFARRGFENVTGVDRSRYLVRLARQRGKKENLNITFREGDARKLASRSVVYNYIFMLGNSFGYFENAEDDLEILQACAKSLTPGGTLVLDITDGSWMKERFEPRSWEWIDQQHFVCRERCLSSAGDRLISREVVTHAEKGVIIDQFYAERLYTETAIRELLQQAGYTNIRFHGAMRPDSERNQDLGMMAQRLLISAQSPTIAAAKLTSQIPFPSVTVLLGDPRLPDTVKLGGQFNAEDMDTIAKLKEALATLKDYHFSFVDNHARLLSSLRTTPPEFVLNLCDEGFDNDAFKELHVPAFLELLNIPYSGAGPNCLGMCYDKSLVNAVAASLDIPVPAETFFTPSDQSATLPTTFPALVKPNLGDSSIGITKDAVVRTPKQLMSYLSQLRHQFPGRPLLIQEYLPGNEFSVGIIGNPGLSTTFLPILEVDYSNLPAELTQILGYESKWMPDSPWWNLIQYRQAELDNNTARNLIDSSMMLFERLGCRDYARFDFRTDSKGIIKLLEVNPNPGWCWDGKMNYMAGFANMQYADFLRLIIEAAQERFSATFTCA